MERDSQLDRKADWQEADRQATNSWMDTLVMA
jgi:hypothetical protein